MTQHRAEADSPVGHMPFRPWGHRILIVLVSLTAATFAGEASAAKQKDMLSRYFEQVHLAGGLFKREHNDYFWVDDRNRRHYLGSSDAGSYVREQFGLTRPVFALSADGERLLYQHSPFFAGKRSKKAAGVYLNNRGAEERLLFPDTELRSVSRSWAKPLPPATLPIFPRQGSYGPYGRNPPLLVTTEGDTYPIGLHGGSALDIAAFHGDVAEVRRLIATGAPTSSTGYGGATALEIAILQGYEEIAHALLAAGVSAGSYPLHLAVTFRQHGLVSTLLRDSAAINIKDDQGDTPLNAAAGKRLVFKSSLLWGDADPALLFGAYTAADVGIMQQLIAAGADIEAKDERGLTPLLNMVDYVVKFPSREFPWDFLASGANLNAVDFRGNNALHLVAQKLREERSPSWPNLPMARLLQVLIDHGVAVDTRNAGGCSPLQLAVQVNNLRTAQLLIDHGADDSTAFIHDGVGPKVEGQTIRQRIDATRRSEWWQEGLH
jgi:ankyrin repeat protein